ncbi:uncharacterized protein [Rutidosis leptorrhynchoides]|uniref:uncharacterized protein n=1 Tax=Rutidosis leptorrhynchoides TaxID=125765 RepID=UPI003A9A5AB8
METRVWGVNIDKVWNGIKYRDWCLVNNNVVSDLKRVWIVFYASQVQLQVLGVGESLRLLWDAMFRIGSDLREPWFVQGHFNMVLRENERQGGQGVDLMAANEFEQCLTDSCLLEMPVRGNFFTWTNYQSVGDRIWSKIDRCVANLEEMDSFPGLYYEVLDSGISDHLPLIVELKMFDGSKKKAFRYYNMWRLHLSYEGLEEGVVSEVTEATQSFFRTGKLVKQFCSTTLTIIPKNASPQSLNDYRPIACCTLQDYSNVITSSLAHVLPSLISPLQSAFVVGRLITNNILMAHELVQNYHKVLLELLCAVKIDIREAYDSMNLDFLEELLSGFCFPYKKEGIVAGRPVSPLLFVLVMEVLYRLLSDTPDRFRFHRECEAMKLNHLCFADDLFLFNMGDDFLVRWMKAQLDGFYGFSGLQVSNAKSSIFFNGGHAGLKRIIVGSCGFREGELSVRYLGVSLISTKLKKEHCFCLAFILSKVVIKLIDAKCRSFLWTRLENSRKSLVAWKSVYRLKREGGLEVIDLVIWNKAAVGK